MKRFNFVNAHIIRLFHGKIKGGSVFFVRKDRPLFWDTGFCISVSMLYNMGIQPMVLGVSKFGDTPFLAQSFAVV